MILPQSSPLGMALHLFALSPEPVDLWDQEVKLFVHSPAQWFGEKVMAGLAFFPISFLAPLIKSVINLYATSHVVPQPFVWWHCCEHSQVRFCLCIFVLSIDWATVALPAMPSARSHTLLVHLLCLQRVISDSQLRKQGGVVSLRVHTAGKWQGQTVTPCTSLQAQVPFHHQLPLIPSIFSIFPPNLYPFWKAPWTIGLTSTEVSPLTWSIPIVFLACVRPFSSHKENGKKQAKPLPLKSYSLVGGDTKQVYTAWPIYNGTHAHEPDAQKEPNKEHTSLERDAHPQPAYSY